MNSLRREVMVMDHDIRHRRMVRISAEGNILQSFDVEYGLDLHLLPNGHTLVNGRKFIVELDCYFNEVWRYSVEKLELMSCTRLENGNTLIGDIGSKSVYELTPRWEKVWEMPFPHNPAAHEFHELFRMIRPMRNGHLLIAWHEAKKVGEFNRQGDLVWSCDLSAGPYEAFELENGNVLVSVGPGGQIVEISKRHGVVWIFDMFRDAGLERGWIAGLCRLPDGNLVFSDSKWDRLIEISPDKRIVGIFQEPDILLHPSSLEVVDRYSKS